MVHPTGKPISHSTHLGFSFPVRAAEPLANLSEHVGRVLPFGWTGAGPVGDKTTATLSGKLFRSNWLGPAVFSESCTVGVGHSRPRPPSPRTASVRLTPARAAEVGMFRLPLAFASPAVGVGQIVSGQRPLFAIESRSRPDCAPFPIRPPRRPCPVTDSPVIGAGNLTRRATAVTRSSPPLLEREIRP